LIELKRTYGSRKWVGGVTANNAALTGAHRKRRLTRPRSSGAFDVQPLIMQR